MCVLLLDVFKHLLLKKVNIFRKENLKKCTSFEEQKGTRCIRENVYFAINIFSCLPSQKIVSQISFNCFFRKREGFYQSSLEKEVDFRDI